MRFTRLLVALALAIVLTGGTAFAQATTTVPGTPATGVGDAAAAQNGLLLASSAAVLLVGAAYLGFSRRLFARS